jgi:hypothetical protein
MDARSDYFARVIPLLGEGLAGKVVAASELSLTGRVLELLASCMLDAVVLRGEPAAPAWPLPFTCLGPARGRSDLELLQRHLRWKNEWSAVSWRREGEPDLALGARLVPPGRPPGVVWDPAARSVTMHLARGDLWSYQNITYHVARQARDLLLGRQPWPDGEIYLGNRLWPYARTEVAVSPPQPVAAARGRAHVMVIGCGSVGSEVVRLLCGRGRRWTLVDGGTVSVFNPNRQWFGTGEIGEPKVEALARRLEAPARRVRKNLGHAPGHAELLAELLETDPPRLAVLAAGTADHGPLARELWRRGIPHVAACAYPQARYFEVTVVLPQEGTPCLHCFRGHLFKGIESAPPMQDDLAAFLYQELSEEQRRRAYVDLVAEPATRIETGRVAEIAARCVAEALAPAARRGLWFRRMLATGTTCLLGGNVVERLGDDDGTTAYGLTFPGQVVRLGLEDVAGAGSERVCDLCGRRMEVVHRHELPAPADDAELDRALLG